MKALTRWAEALLTLMFPVWLLLPVSSSPGAVAVTGQTLLALWGLPPETGWLFWAFCGFRLLSLGAPASWKRTVGPLAPVTLGLWFLASLALVIGTLAPLYLWGFNPAWFSTLPPSAGVLVILGTGANGLSLVALVDQLNLRNPVYREYRDFVRAGKHRTGVPGSPVAETFDRLRRIRGKLLMAFTGIIVVILVVLSSVLLSNYQRSILKAVGDGARAQVTQAASVYKANLGAGTDGSQTAIAMFDYLNSQTRVNGSAAFPFRSFIFYTDLKSHYLLDQRGSRPYPDLQAEYSSEFKDTRFPGAPVLAGRSVGIFLSPYASDGLHDPDAKTYSYAAPILKNDFEKKADGTKVRHDQLLGLAVITFDEDVILAPYVQTRTEVFVLTALFLYFALVLVFVVGNLIVYPLLFLRMNVRNVSDSLQTMVRGDSRISAANLRFNDTVTSKDEIKSLSGEIDNMVTVIKGIIPYISASTLRQAETGRASSKVKDLTFLFTDIRGFTALCEGRAPEEIVTLLNRYLDLETEIILANHGDIDKFVGDEVMAFFDGPEKELNACRAAMQIRQAMYEERTLRKTQGLPAVEIGIGINTGSVVFGSVGARDRMDFTSIGDTVNLAARLEGTNKVYGSKSIISDAVFREVKDHFVCRELDFVAVVGKNEPIRIYELLQTREAAAEKLVSLADTFGTGLRAYRNRDWPQAGRIFGDLADRYQDGPSAMFIDRIRSFEKSPPPENWDGVYRMETK